MKILETFPRVFCFLKSRINENGGKSFSKPSWGYFFPIVHFLNETKFIAKGN